MMWISTGWLQGSEGKQRSNDSEPFDHHGNRTESILILDEATGGVQNLDFIVVRSCEFTRCS